MNLMARNRVLRSALLAAGVLMIAACASQPEGSLLEKKFQQTAKQYLKFQHEGQTVYCKKEQSRLVQCISEAQLRLQVENFERDRNPVQYVRTPPGVG